MIIIEILEAQERFAKAQMPNVIIMNRHWRTLTTSKMLESEFFKLLLLKPFNIITIERRYLLMS